MKKKLINLYYYTNVKNIGDMLSPIIISSICKCSIHYKKPMMTFKQYIKSLWYQITNKKKTNNNSYYMFPHQKCLFAIGSILDFSNEKCIVWGAGFREPYSNFCGGLVYAVRGYLTRDKLPANLQNVAIGDPALLLPLIYKTKVVNNNKECIGIVPHYCDYDDLYNEFSERYCVLNVSTDEVFAFINKLTSFNYILSSSLHGLIIAHSYGIPAIWIRRNDIKSSSFKFHDYFSSVQIPLYDGFDNIDEILKNDAEWHTFFIKHKELSLPHINLDDVQKELLKSFPFVLKKTYKKYIL